jgi:hypothetical protein
MTDVTAVTTANRLGDSESLLRISEDAGPGPDRAAPRSRATAPRRNRGCGLPCCAREGAAGRTPIGPRSRARSAPRAAHGGSPGRGRRAAPPGHPSESSVRVAQRRVCARACVRRAQWPPLAQARRRLRRGRRRLARVGGARVDRPSRPARNVLRCVAYDSASREANAV